MKKVTALLALVVALFVGIVGASVSESISRYIDQKAVQEAQRHALELRARELELAREQAEAAATAPASIIFTYFMYGALAVAIGLLLSGCYDAYKARTKPVIGATNGTLRLSPEALLRMTTEQQVALFAATYQAQTAVALEQAKASVAAPHILHTHAPTAALPATTAPALITTEPTPLALPELAPLREALPAIPKGHIAYGRGAGGELISLPLATGYHGLFMGDTRSGKSNAIDSMIVQLHHMSRRLPITLYAGDYKQELAATWSRSPLFAAGIQTEPKQIAEMLGYLVHGEDGIKARYARFAEVGQAEGRIIRNLGEYAKVTGEQPRLTVCFIDELNAVLEAAGKDKELASNLKQALQMGAGAGIYITGGAQYLTAATFGRDGSKQFVTRAMFGAFDTTAANMLFGSVEREQLAPYITGQPGRGLIRTVGKPEPVPFQALLAEEADILEAIEVAEPATGATVPLSLPTYSITPATTSAQSPVEPVIAAQSPVVVMQPEPTEEQRIIAAAKEYTSRTALCEALYGTTGGGPYRRVQQVLDGAGLLMPRKRERVA